jgi:hypothetical protein
MKLASLVISLDLAQSLFDFGIHNESILYWYQERYVPHLELFLTGQSQQTMTWKIHIGRPSKENKNVFKEVAAFTCSELGNILPGFIKKNGIVYFFRTFRSEKEWECCYQDYNDKKLTGVLGKNETDARGALLFNILWNKFIDITDTL